MAPADFWAQWLGTPLWWLSITLLVYLLALALYQRSGHNPLVNPVALSIAGLSGVLWLSGTPYTTYFESAQLVHFLLGPATVALAVPLFEQSRRLRHAWLPLLGGIVVGTLTTTASALGLAWALGASKSTLASLVPKSVTTPVAMGISQQLGGLPSLTAVLVVTTGIVGAASARWWFARLHIADDPMVRGLALGVAAHGIGTARAFQIDEETGAFAGLAMGLTALFSALVLPWLAAPLLRWL